MAQRYRTARDGNIDPGYWNPDIGGRQGQREQSRGDEGGDWASPARGAARRDSGLRWSDHEREQDRVQGQRPMHEGRRHESGRQDHSQAYDENAEGWRRAGYGDRGGAEQRHAAPPDLEYDQGWHSNADWSGEGDVVPRYGRGQGGRRQRRSRGSDEGNYPGQARDQSWDQASGAYAAPWDEDSDLQGRGGARGYGAPRGHGVHGPGGRGTEGRDWRGAQQTTGRDYFSRDDDGSEDYRRDYGGFVAPEQSRGGRQQGRRTSPYSGSSAGYVTGEALGDESWNGEFIGRTDHADKARDYEPDFGRGSRSHRGPSHRGKGPKGYARSAERIREEVCEWLADDDLVDASEISVSCGEGGVLVLEGTVDSLQAKHRAEMIADQCTGVREVDSRLRVARPSRLLEQGGRDQTGEQSGSMQSGAMQSGAGSTSGSETGSVGRQERGQGQGQEKESQGGGSRTASSYSMLAASRDADKDKQKH